MSWTLYCDIVFYFILDRICEYFGVKIALYFAYLGHYTVALCFPTVLGIMFWFIQDENEVGMAKCPPNTWPVHG